MLVVVKPVLDATCKKLLAKLEVVGVLIDELVDKVGLVVVNVGGVVDVPDVIDEGSSVVIAGGVVPVVEGGDKVDEPDVVEEVSVVLLVESVLVLDVSFGASLGESLDVSLDVSLDDEVSLEVSLDESFAGSSPFLSDFFSLFSSTVIKGLLPFESVDKPNFATTMLRI